VPGRSTTTAGVAGECFDNGVRVQCAGAAASSTTTTSGYTSEFTVDGAVLALRLPDGRTAVVACGSKLALTTGGRRSCRVPPTDSLQAEFNGKNAKLFWVVNVDGRKLESETYRVMEIAPKAGEMLKEAANPDAIVQGWIDHGKLAEVLQANAGSICPPPGVTTRQVTQAFLSYVQTHPDASDSDAPLALKAAWPCVMPNTTAEVSAADWATAEELTRSWIDSGGLATVLRENQNTICMPSTTTPQQLTGVIVRYVIADPETPKTPADIVKAIAAAWPCL